MIVLNETEIEAIRSGFLHSIKRESWAGVREELKQIGIELDVEPPSNNVYILYGTGSFKLQLLDYSNGVIYSVVIQKAEYLGGWKADGKKAKAFWRFFFKGSPVEVKKISIKSLKYKALVCNYKKFFRSEVF